MTDGRTVAHTDKQHHHIKTKNAKMTERTTKRQTNWARDRETEIATYRATIVAENALRLSWVKLSQKKGLGFGLKIVTGSNYIDNQVSFSQYTSNRRVLIAVFFRMEGWLTGGSKIFFIGDGNILSRFRMIPAYFLILGQLLGGWDWESMALFQLDQLTI